MIRARGSVLSNKPDLDDTGAQPATDAVSLERMVDPWLRIEGQTSVGHDDSKARVVSRQSAS